MNYLVGFDIGTSSTRCILIDTSGKLIASSTKEYDMDTPKPGWAEQHPHLWWEATVATVAAAPFHLGRVQPLICIRLADATSMVDELRSVNPKLFSSAVVSHSTSVQVFARARVMVATL